MSGEYLCTGIIAKELKQEHLLIDIEQTNVLDDALREAVKKSLVCLNMSRYVYIDALNQYY